MWIKRLSISSKKERIILRKHISALTSTAGKPRLVYTITRKIKKKRREKDNAIRIFGFFFKSITAGTCYNVNKRRRENLSHAAPLVTQGSIIIPPFFFFFFILSHEQSQKFIGARVMPILYRVLF